MTLPLMPKATAVWLIENTKLTFEQIGAFCGMHPLEVQGIADGEVAVGIVGQDPVSSGQLAAGSIAKCEADPAARLEMNPKALQHLSPKGKGTRYTPVARRQDKPDAIAWLIKYHPELTEANIIKLIGTTKNTIRAVRERSHWNISNIKPKDPVLLGLCKQVELDDMVARVRIKGASNA
ncbi:MAG: DUF1013 domain-containing protein [Alphaproteobacteria bacterium]|nr:DUF1013 domain-containing protein [Alphaproteobacteria bacterium]